MKDTKGGVSMLILNTDPSAQQTMEVPVGAQRYTLTASSLISNAVRLGPGDVTRVEIPASPFAFGVTR